MINIGICEGNIEHRLELCRFLDIYFSSHSYSYKIYTFDDGEELINYYHENPCNIKLLFIEINLPKLNGYDVSKTIRKIDDSVSIVINTGITSYALKIYEIWPLYYNIKPLKYKTLSNIVDRFIKQDKSIREDNLLVKNGKRFMNLSYNEITYIESQNTTLKIHMNNYEILKTYGKLDDIEVQLSNKRFLRCHKSFLINMDYIKSVEAYKFTTIFGDTVSIKQREASKIKKIYYDYVTQKECYEKEI